MRDINEFSENVLQILQFKYPQYNLINLQIAENQDENALKRTTVTQRNIYTRFPLTPIIEKFR